MKLTFSISIFLSFTLGFIFLFFQNIIPVNEKVLSWEFIIYYILVLNTLWISAGKRLTPFILFYLTFGLFIGGRFFAVGFGYNESIFAPTFFWDYYVDDVRKIEIMRYVIGFILMSMIGYVLSKGIKLGKLKKLDFRISNFTIKELNNFLKLCFPLFLITTLYYSGTDLIRVIKGGYLALYLGRQTESYAVGASIILALNSAFFGIALGYGDQKNKNKYLFLFIIRAIIDVIIGSRRSFGAMLLVFLWLWSEKKKISFKKISFFILLSFSILLIVASFSLRAISPNSNMLDSNQLIYSFLYSQGITLMVFDSSRLITDYPVIGYFNSVFPGTNLLYSQLTFKTLFPKDIGWSNWMCYQFNPEYFESGAGLGWSLLSDIYLYSGRIFPFFLILSSTWALFIGVWERIAKYSRFMNAWMFMVIMPIVIIPRASLGSIIPQVYYLLLFFLILLFFVQLKCRYQMLKRYD